MQSGYFRVDSDDFGVFAKRMFSGDSSQIIRESRFTQYELKTVLWFENGHYSVIAEGDSARARVWQLLDEHDVDPVYPDAVYEEVGHLLQNTGLEDQSLQDRTGLAFITIDNEDSRDLDQAMYIEKQEGGYAVFYALADAAHYVPAGSALFNDALKRGASYYLPEMSVPMLPAALSEGLISLNPEVPRRALIFVIQLDQDTQVLESRIERARIVSRAKLSYNGVQDFHDNPHDHELADRDFTETLQLLREVGEKRIDLARQRNVVEYDRLSLDVRYAGEAGETFEITEDRRIPVESWNEQISLLCNHQGASMLLEAQSRYHIQPIYRVHEAPDLERLKKFSSMLNKIISKHSLEPRIWLWRWRDGSFGKKESIAEYLRRLPDSTTAEPLKRAITHQAQMLNNASVFTALPGPHHSLKLEGYARFSSPMREIAGIFTHKEILEFCSDSEASERVIEEDLSLRDKVIDAANEARTLQKKLTKAVYKFAIDDLLQKDLSLPAEHRPIRQGVIFGVRPTRLFVRLENPAIDVKLYADNLEEQYGDPFKVDKGYVVLFSDHIHFTVGQTLQLKLNKYDETRKRWVLQPV